MKRRAILAGIGLGLASALLIVWPAQSCTRIFWNSGAQAVLSARSMDLYFNDNPILILNPKGQKRDGGIGQGSHVWTSKYGSFVLAELANPEYVSDGMNEKGLAAHLLYLYETEYEKRDFRPGVLYGRMIQYLLDVSGSVDEALEALAAVQLVPRRTLGQTWPLHYALEDASGDSAILEWIDGKLLVYRGEQYKVLTNVRPDDPDYLEAMQECGENCPHWLPEGGDPESRMIRAAKHLKALGQAKDPLQAKAALQDVLANVSVKRNGWSLFGFYLQADWPTLWTVAYDLNNLSADFHYLESGFSCEIDLKTQLPPAGSSPLVLAAPGLKK